MKRLIAIALICLFAFVLGCGGASEPAPASPDEAGEAAVEDEGAGMEEAPMEEEAAPMEDEGMAEEGADEGGEAEADAPAE